MPTDQKPTPQGSPFEIITPHKSGKINAKTVLLSLVILMFLGVSVFLGVYLVGQRTNLAQRAAPATAMFVTPGSQSKTPGSNFSYTVNIDTSTNAVTGVDVRMVFNPSVMQVVSLQPGTGITDLNQTITNTYDNVAGTISFAVFTLDSSKAVIGSGIQVLTVNATVKSGATAGSYNIAFDPATAASASQEGQNVLVSKSQGVLVVAAQAGATPTATATATAAPTATATATASPTPTSNPNATKTPTPTPTATATNNPSATKTPTATPTATSTSSSGAQTSPLPIPVSGTGWPTYLGAMVGILTILGAVFLAL